MHPRMIREQLTIEKMTGIFCHENHKTQKGKLCKDCQELFAYAMLRLQHCPFQEGKTSCGNCSIHCYKHTMREKIRKVMRFAGPRMTWRYPLLAITHLIDGFRKEPIRENRNGK